MTPFRNLPRGRVLDTRGESQDAFRDPEFSPRAFRHAPVGGRRQMRDQAPGVAEVVRDLRDLESVLKTGDLSFISMQTIDGLPVICSAMISA